MIIHTNKLSGEIDISARMPSKSIMHRMLICASLCGQEMQVNNPSDDISATRECMNSLLNDDNPVLNVRDSASTLRFLIPLALALDKPVKFVLGDSLVRRPITEYNHLLPYAEFASNGNNLTVSGKILPGKYVVNCDIQSSQFVSGLLFALPLLAEDSHIIIEEIQSQSYVELTLHTLKRFGIDVIKTESGYCIPGNQAYKKAGDLTVEGDWSYAANFIVANKLGSKIVLKGLNTSSKQGDSVIQSIDLTQKEIDVSQCVDIFPILAVSACKKHGETVLTNAKRLRLKECDRLHAMYLELKSLGAEVYEYDSALKIIGKGSLRGGNVSSHNDHRIAMCLTVAAQLCETPVILTGYETVRKSAPDFFSDFSSLGGKYELLG